MKKKSLLFTLILMFICTGASVSLIPDTVQAAIGDHVYSITIEMGRNYGDPTDPDDTDYIAGLAFYTDATVEKIIVNTPGGDEFEINKWWSCINRPGGCVASAREYDTDEGAYEWWIEFEAEYPEARNIFGDGRYDITVYYEFGLPDQTTAWFGIPYQLVYIPEPTQEPVFTNFAQGDVLVSPVNFTWNLCTDSAADVVWFGWENLATGEEGEEDDGELSVNATKLPEPLTLDVGIYEINLGFEVWYNYTNSDGINVEVGKYAEVDYQLSIRGNSSNISDHVSLIEIDRGYTYQYPGTSDDEYAFDLCLFADDTVNEVAFLTPQGEDWTFDAEGDSGSDDDYWYDSGMEYDPDRKANEWCFEANANSLEALENFGDGNYSIVVYYENGSSDQTTVWFGIPGTTDPIVPVTEEPVITNPTHNSTIASPFTFEWNPCSGAVHTTIDVEEYYSGEEIIDEYWPGCSTDSYLPGMILPAGKYEFNLQFENFYSDTSSDGVGVYVGKYSESEHIFTVLEDSDCDGIADSEDNCPSTFNPQQLDTDNDGIGDLCDDTPGCGGCGESACEADCTAAVEDLVTHYYLNILRRAPDSGGLDYWRDEIMSLYCDGSDIKDGFILLAQTFFNSDEYLGFNRDNTGYVTDLYRTFFNREPDQGGLDYWVNELEQGMSRSDELDFFVHSAEFNDYMEENLCLS